MIQVAEVLCTGGGRRSCIIFTDGCNTISWHKTVPLKAGKDDVLLSEGVVEFSEYITQESPELVSSHRILNPFILCMNWWTRSWGLVDHARWANQTLLCI